MTEEKSDREDGPASSDIQPISLQPFAIQLLNVVPIEIVARRFPVDISDNTQINIGINIVGLDVNPDSLQAQVVTELKLEPSQEPHAFEMFFRIVGLFSYAAEYKQDAVQQYLQQGSLSVMLPFMRELVFNLSMRLQISPIMLSLVQLAPPPEIPERGNTDETAQDNIQNLEEK